MQLYQSFWWLIQSFPTILDISSSVFKFRWKKPISSMKPLWFSLSGIEQKYNWRIFIFCPFFLLFHLFIHFQTFSYFFPFLPFQVEEPISSSKPSQFPGSNGHVNSNETVKYWYSAQLCCCFISLENYNFLQEKILPTRYSCIFSLFYTPVFRQDVLWYGAVRPSVRPSVRSSVRPTVSTKKHRCKWRIFFKFCTQVCLGVPSINLLFVLSYLIKYAHNSTISDFSIFGIHRVIF